VYRPVLTVEHICCEDFSTLAYAYQDLVKVCFDVCRVAGIELAYFATYSQCGLYAGDIAN
jgi:hypothetical protein